MAHFLPSFAISEAGGYEKEWAWKGRSPTPKENGSSQLTLRRGGPCPLHDSLGSHCDLWECASSPVNTLVLWLCGSSFGTATLSYLVSVVPWNTDLALGATAVIFSTGYLIRGQLLYSQIWKVEFHSMVCPLKRSFVWSEFVQASDKPASISEAYAQSQVNWGDSSHRVQPAGQCFFLCLRPLNCFMYTLMY